MLCKDKIISIFCLIDYILQGIEHQEDIRIQVSDSKIILTTIVSSTSFYGNHCSAIKFMKQYGFIPNMFDKIRFNRRLYKVGKLLYELFEIVSSYFKDFCCEMHYIIDSFPVAICNNMRIANFKIVKEKKWSGYTASMQSYFYGVKVQLLITKDRIPIAFQIKPKNQIWQNRCCGIVYFFLAISLTFGLTNLESISSVFFIYFTKLSFFIK